MFVVFGTIAVYLFCLYLCVLLVKRTANWRISILAVLVGFLAIQRVTGLYGRQLVWENLVTVGFDDAIGFGLAAVTFFTVAYLDVVFAEQAKARVKLTERALHDVLTELPNRAFLLQNVGRALARNVRHKDHKFALLFIDLDGFKGINDRFGHQVGDQVLLEISKRLEQSVRATDTLARPSGEETVARLGGDEFCVLLENVDEPTDALRVAERIRAQVTEPVQIDETTINIDSSIGIAWSAGDYDEPEQILRDADTAMYRAKANGKGSIQIFEKSMHDDVVWRLELEAELRQAIDNDDFDVAYQPIISLQSGNIVGVEALARWNHSTRGPIPPSEFIPVAESAGIIGHIDRCVLKRALNDICAWRGRLVGAALSISVNVSSLQFEQGSFEEIENMVQGVNLKPGDLRFEITETKLLQNIESTLVAIKQLNLMNIRLHVDDFGIGYSSLSYLHQFKMDLLKIDRSFVSEMTAEPKRAEIVRIVIALAKNLDMEVTAEGVETAEQLESLRELGCDYAQGFYFSKPIDSEKTFELLALNPKW